MADNYTTADKDAMVRTANCYHFCVVGLTIFAFVVWNGAIILRRRRITPLFWFPMAFLGPWYIGYALDYAVRYFGIPRAFTLGLFTIPPALPASCAASLAIEGENGVPCSVKRLLTWLSGATGYERAGVETWWFGYGLSGLASAVALLIALLIGCIAWIYEDEVGEGLQIEEAKRELSREKGSVKTEV